MRKGFLLLALLVVVPAAVAQVPSEGEKLHALFREHWEWQLAEDPIGATYVGDRRYDHLMGDWSGESMERIRAKNREWLQRIDGIDRSKLTADDRLNYDLFRRDAEMSIRGSIFPGELMPIHQMGGVYSLLPELAQAIPRDTVKDHENFLARLREYPRVLDQVIAQMRRGLARGVTPPRMVLGRVASLIEAQLIEDPARSPIYEYAFTKFGASIPAAEQQRLQAEARKVLKNDVEPAIRKLHRFWVDEYYPKTRETIAMSALPNGAAWYAHRVRSATTTEMTPEEIHELGLKEVARIRAEMERIKSETGFQGTLPEFFTFLRTDERFFHKSREDLLLGYRDIAKRIDPALMRLFGKLPRIPYGVLPIPEYSEKTATTAYYNGPSIETNRPGYFHANLYDLKSRPKWEMEALTLHEAVPGHHLQISLALELTDLPHFRRQGYYPAFGEGWGLYSESLGSELGLYTDPYSKFGQLTYEMWRAIRLVVDPAIHVKGWSRQQAIDYARANTGRTLPVIEVEIDRYIVSPGGATSYKIGELKIRELRRRAEKELGEKFDIRAFHDTLLGAGALPLSILETRMNEWIASRR
ncbi:MAG TPA: DUF885 domain-containing protein [Thermoanaerobaculia bacterium]|jgi:uncharacterized protein (DUF885 family)